MIHHVSGRYMIGPKCILQRYNDPKHTAEVTEDYCVSSMKQNQKSWKWNLPAPYQFLQVPCVQVYLEELMLSWKQRVVATHTEFISFFFFSNGFSVHFTGSTDVISCSVYGVRDPATAAMHIVLGKPSPTYCRQDYFEDYLIYCYN